MKHHERDAVVARAKEMLATNALPKKPRENASDHHQRVYDEALKQIRAEANAAEGN